MTIRLMRVERVLTGIEFDCCGIEEAEKQDEDGRDLKVGLL